jgi:hypothetical protein
MGFIVPVRLCANYPLLDQGRQTPAHVRREERLVGSEHDQHDIRVEPVHLPDELAVLWIGPPEQAGPAHRVAP